MALRIMTNDAAINAQRNLEMSSIRLQSTQEKLSSGYRINRAADDAAGLAISDTLNATIRSIGQAIRNAHDGASLVQVFEGGTNEVTAVLTRIRELAMQAASDTVGDRERLMINNEVQELKMEVDRISLSTKYSGHVLLDGTAPALEFQIGTDNNPDKDRIVFDAGDADLRAASLEVDGLDFRDKLNAQESLEILDAGIQKINEIRAKVGSVQSRLQTIAAAQMLYSENLTAAKSRIRDADMAVESTNFAKESIIRSAGVAMLSQANQTPSIALQLLRGFGG